MDHERGTYINLAGGGNKPIMFFNDLFTEGKTYTGSLEFVVTVKALKYHKNFLGIFLVKPDSVIRNGNPVIIFAI